jgi:hypothetical protein
MDEVVQHLRRSTDQELQEQAMQLIRIAIKGQWIATDDAMWAALIQVAKERAR